jgi:hypothetical protein
MATTNKSLSPEDKTATALVRHTLATFRERGLSKHFSKVLLSAAGAELVKRPPQLLRGDRCA